MIMKRILFFFILIGSIIFFGYNHLLLGEGVESDAKTDAIIVYDIAEDIKNIVLKKDIDSLLKYALDNQTVDGVNWEKKSLEKLLLDRKSYYYCRLFDTICLKNYIPQGYQSKKYLSYYNFFKDNPDLIVGIDFNQGETKEKHKRVKIIYIIGGHNWNIDLDEVMG